MRRMPWATCLWPGLPQLWVRGSWSALAVAVTGAVLLNLALLGSFGWSELVGPDVRRALWAALGIVWAVAAIASVAWSRRLADRGQADSTVDTFGEALGHYLRGDWFQAERALGDLLRRDARDLDARLMLATLFRHTGRYDEARGQLDVLVRLEGIAKWELEVRRERELLAEASKRTDNQVEETAGPGSTGRPAEPGQAA